ATSLKRVGRAGQLFKERPVVVNIHVSIAESGFHAPPERAGSADLAVIGQFKAVLRIVGVFVRRSVGRGARAVEVKFGRCFNGPLRGAGGVAIIPGIAWMSAASCLV